MICNEKMFSEDARIFRAKVQVTLHHQVHAIPMPYSCPRHDCYRRLSDCCALKISRNFNRNADKQKVTPANLKFKAARYVS